MSIEKAVALIAAQQEKIGKGKPAWCVGEQLKDILQGDEAAAAIVAQDLEQGDNMGIAVCERAIHDFASKNGGFCGGRDAEDIIRKFYGIEKAAAPAQTVHPRRHMVNVADFL